MKHIKKIIFTLCLSLAQISILVTDIELLKHTELQRI